MLELDMGLINVGVNYLLINAKKEIIGGDLYDDTNTILKAAVANIADGSRTFTLKRSDSIGNVFLKSRPGKYLNLISKISNKYSWFSEVIFVFCKRNKNFFITSYEKQYEDFWNILMSNFDLPIMENWSEYIFQKSMECGYLRKGEVFFEDRTAKISLGVRDVQIGDVLVYDIEDLDENKLEDIISKGLKSREIYIEQKDASSVKELDLSGGLGVYMNNYSETIVKNVSDSLKPLSPVSGAVENFAIKNLQPLPPQATCVSGIVELSKQSQYGFMVEEMGTGKTLQAIAAVESKFNSEYISKHHGATIEDCFIDGNVRYRVIVMCPSHLVVKWREDLERNIHNPLITVLDTTNGIKVLQGIRGKKPLGREFYIVSMTQAKIDYAKMPSPTVEKIGKVGEVKFCKYCFDELNEFNLMPYGRKCKKCGGSEYKIHYKRYELSDECIIPPKAMVCPECNKLLIKPVSTVSQFVEKEDIFLSSIDFDKHRGSNHKCFHCGASLWKPAVKTLASTKDEKWVLFKHYKNYKCNSTVTDFVLRRNKREVFLNTPQKLRIGTFEESFQEVTLKSRRYSIASFIKKYIKFDMCILDEAHKYEGEGTGQAQAAHSISSASAFTLCLTGTLLNGKADSIFNLLYMLDPKRMQERGYEFGESHEFAKKYGTVETEYAYDGDDLQEAEYKTSCKGRMTKPPTVKPGISPMLYTDYLLDKCVMLNLTDLSKFMPKLIEKVVAVDLEDDIAAAYMDIMGQLKSLVRSTEGRSVLGSIFTLGLSYPDKPYDKKDIVSSYGSGVICKVKNIDEYRDRLLKKEEKLIEIVNEELSQERNMFIFCSNTGKGEYKITGRLQKVLESNCCLDGAVEVIESGKPDAKERYDYIKKRASEGIKVFICNYKQVETGVDFSFEHQGVRYNYPTIIFYQIGTELASVWQASGRAYRLNQTEECHTYFLGYKGTMQINAIELFAEKKAAVSAIQGKFTSEGIAAMAKGVDERMRLVEALSNEVGNINIDNIENMFGVLNSTSKDTDIDSILIKEYNSALKLKDILKDNEKMSPVLSSLLNALDVQNSKEEECTIVDSVITKEETIETFVPNKKENSDTSESWDVFRIMNLLGQRTLAKEAKEESNKKENKKINKEEEWSLLSFL